MSLTRWLALVLLALLALGGATAAAHEFRPAVLSLRQLEPGRFAYRWQPAFDAKRRPLDDVRPVFPEHCELVPVGLGSEAAADPWVSTHELDCQGRGLGELSVAGLRHHPVDVVVRVRWSDERERTAVLHGERDHLVLGDGSVGQTSAGLLGTYLALGVEHILIGIDHVLFVLGLLLLVGWHRRLLAAITGFTLAHSLTLAASTLGVAALPQGPVEVCIALSIVLLAAELVHERPTLTRRLPGVVAFAFGLLHGFGFAGALQEIGVPPDRAWLSLLGFNLGVEVGQLGIIAAAGVVGVVVRRLPRPERWRIAAAYAGGTVAAAWTIERGLGLLQG
ncbi:HupE/UreJ family protein [Paraliomyxa miuraensis]|uniref:HupE/UreJ family protein n=1 Tax=Paraliomyxa miuraensis TaxID=376150 RepID=UPI00224F986B|nr:HupE/UreJ family protein [Paraliomyxa miuraensis]MCX4245000.1 HupE/UreJ family protein [Paraliomyxa miuraensis]